MIIENINTGERFEVADGTNYPASAYREVRKEAPKPEQVVVKDTAPQFEPKAPAKKPAKKKKKPAKKKTSKKSKK